MSQKYVHIYCSDPLDVSRVVLHSSHFQPTLIPSEDLIGHESWHPKIIKIGFFDIGQCEVYISLRPWWLFSRRDKYLFIYFDFSL